MGDTLALGLLWYLTFLFSTTLHEAAHARAALALGDPTATRGGQSSLNPWPHVVREPFGMVLVPVLSYLLAGWVMGWASAPYDPAWAERYPRRAAWMALAGPASNLLLVVAAGAAIRLGVAGGLFRPPAVVRFSHVTESLAAGSSAGLATLLSIVFSLNLILLLFNLLPLPPLDGSGALPLLLNARLTARWRELQRLPMIGLLGIVLAWRAFPLLFAPVQRLALALLYPGLGYG